MLTLCEHKKFIPLMKSWQSYYPPSRFESLVPFCIPRNKQGEMFHNARQVIHRKAICVWLWCHIPKALMHDRDVHVVNKEQLHPTDSIDLQETTLIMLWKQTSFRSWIHMHMLSLIYKHKIYAFPHSFMLVLKRCYPCISHFNCQLSKFEDNMKPQNKTFFN